MLIVDIICGIFVYTMVVVFITSLACASGKRSACEEAYKEGYEDGIKEKDKDKS